MVLFQVQELAYLSTKWFMDYQWIFWLPALDPPTTDESGTATSGPITD